MMNDENIDFIYNTIDILARNDHCEDIDALLWTTEIYNASEDLMLTLLTATLPYKSKLRLRQSFFLESQRKLGVELVKGLE